MNMEKKNTDVGALILRSTLQECGFLDCEELSPRSMKGALVLVKQEMDAMDMVNAIHSLQSAADMLVDALAEACGSCQGCDGHLGEHCPFEGMGNSENIRVPDEYLNAAGIPLGAKLCAEPVLGENAILISEAAYSHDLSDVPDYVLEDLIGAGVCLGKLEEHLMDGDVIYRG